MKGNAAMPPVSIVVLAKYNAIFAGFKESVDKFVDQKIKKILVLDVENDIDITALDDSWMAVQGQDPFSMAGNGNIGLRIAAQNLETDVLYCGDDVRFTSPNTVGQLAKIANLKPEIGILSPKLVGRGSPKQTNPKKDLLYISPLEMWFPCVYIKRAVLLNVGYLDEEFKKFGSDDCDLCIRTVLAGYKLAVTSIVSVQHEASEQGGPTTFEKKLGTSEREAQETENFQKLLKKWGVTPTEFALAMQKGDFSAFQKKSSPSEPSQADALKYLRTRSLHIATPAYGGWVSVNYINSLLGTINMCRDLGIQHAVSFKYNESLITRARNAMVGDYLNQEEPATDFVFIDADIGWDPRDIITLMLQQEDIIGAPCVRKSFNWGRIADIIRQSNGNLTPAMLQKAAGEFVINFPPGEIPKSINLGQVIEVQDVGTGLMRVKREVFHKFATAYPDRWYMPMTGEGSVRPTFMFFQSYIDPDTKKLHSEGIPQYISEDYAFCRDARKAGMHVYLAPWMKTSHMGSYMYEGDLEVVAKNGGKLY